MLILLFGASADEMSLPEDLETSELGLERKAAVLGDDSVRGVLSVLELDSRRDEMPLGEEHSVE